MNVSVVLVSYNTKELTLAALASVFEKTSGVSFEVIVVDNASSDGSAEMIRADFPQVRLIENKENRGFGAANNAGIKTARGKYIFLLNTDAILLNNGIELFFKFMESPQNLGFGCIGAVLIDGAMKPQISGGKFPSLTGAIISNFFFGFIFPHFYRKFFYKQSPRPQITDYVLGADMFIRRSALDTAGMFDEDFFLFYEEAELSHRFAAKGYKSAIIAGPQIIH
ncbi:MAG: glycosyltransferase family 2 protein, partial [Elusimicrobia bacterium]|nr:glycosyltransferase family 2 protein [Elusimicrobiota bacterium]